MLSTTKLQGIGSKVGGSRHVSSPVPGQYHRKREDSFPKCLNQHNLNPFAHSLDVFGCAYNLLPLLPDMSTPSPKHANDWSLLARPPMRSPRLSDFHSVQGPMSFENGVTNSSLLAQDLCGFKIKSLASQEAPQSQAN